MTRKKVYLIVLACLLSVVTDGQIGTGLEKAYQRLMNDSQFKAATIGLLVVEAETGNIVISKNDSVGLAPASTQKILTSIAGFELLKSSYRYKTTLAYDGKIENNILTGNLVIIGTGDPTLGSWRWNETKPEHVISGWLKTIRTAGITRVNGKVITVATDRYQSGIPGGWIWDDIGNYYGAGSYAINWKENQYDLILQSSNNVGEWVKIISSKPASIMKRSFRNELKAAEKGSGDNAYIYFPVVGNTYLLRGTIPAGENNFSISGASQDPASDLVNDLLLSAAFFDNRPGSFSKSPRVVLHTILSPSFDSMNYWFMKKSINLYGEAFIKTLAILNKQEGSTENGVRVLEDFWISKGIQKQFLQLKDGSGLSPQNRVTVRALVHALQFARTENWFPSFHLSLPVINNMRIKSGSIGGARSYAGYHTSSSGKTYTFAIIANNYSGSSSVVERKLLALLDLLK